MACFGTAESAAPAVTAVELANHRLLDPPVSSLAAQRTYIVYIAAVAAVPVWRTAELISADAALMTALVFASAAWHGWRYVPREEGARRTTSVASLGLALCAWQLAWVGLQETWFLRAAIVIWAVAATALWGSLARGWRVIAAFAMWAAALSAPPPAFIDAAGDWVAERTAVAAGWLLWQGGHDLAVHGATVQTATGSVAVGAACTGLPLAWLLLELLAIAAVLLRLRISSVLRVAFVTVLGAFFIGAARVALLTVVANNKPAFGYWHGQAGGAWFSAVGVLLLAWILTRAKRRVPDRPTPACSARAVMTAWHRTVWPIAAGALTSILVAASHPPQNARTGAAPSIPDIVLTRETMTRLVPHGATSSDQFTALQEASYRSENAQISVALAAVPVMFTGDPRGLAAGHDRLPMITDWSVLAIGDGDEVWRGHEPGRTVWLAVITPEGRSIARHDDWLRQYRAAFGDSARWWAWATHRRALPDKTAGWLLVSLAGSETDTPAGDRTIAATHRTWRHQAMAMISETEARGN